MVCSLKTLKFFGLSKKRICLPLNSFFVNSLSKNKVNTFGADKPKFSDFKSYMKEFYYIVNFYEQYPNNIIFCGLEVLNFTFKMTNNNII